MNRINNANFPMSLQGQTYHVECKQGQVANNILTVGDHGRAQRLSSLFESIEFTHSSSRGFLTITGSYMGVRMSIIAIGMGYPMMDMFIREVRAITQGPLKIIRLGSCGGLDSEIHVGDVIVQSGSLMIQRNWDYFDTQTSVTDEPYRISRICQANQTLSDALLEKLCKEMPNAHPTMGLNATADSFYSSQGRQGDAFVDANQGLLQDLKSKYPDLKTLEMETFTLYHLASVEKNQEIVASGIVICFANRSLNEFIEKDKVKELELSAGKVVFDVFHSLRVIQE